MISPKHILHINLTTGGSEVRSYADLAEWVGGIGVGLKLWVDKDTPRPIIFTNGPFTAAFPYAAYTCAVFYDKKKKRVAHTYAGGRLAVSLRFSGLDGVVLEGKVPQPSYLVVDDGRVNLFEFSAKDKTWGKVALPDRKSSVVVLENKVLVDNYFNFGKRGLAEALRSKNLLAIMVSGSHYLEVAKPDLYEKVYKEISSLGRSFVTKYSKTNHSCSGCTVACLRARRGGSGPDAYLTQCLVGCPLSARVYENVPLVFSGLTALGSPHPHELLEELPKKITELLEELS